MQQFVIPQFIDVEDKVIGPISVRQFITLLCGVVVIFLSYELIYRLNNNPWFFALSAFFIGALCLIIAFVRINGRPFHYFLLSLIVALKEPRLRIWSKEVSLYDLKRERPSPEKPVISPPPKRGLTASKLATLSLIVDTGGAFAADNAPEITIENKQNRFE